MPPSCQQKVSSNSVFQSQPTGTSMKVADLSPAPTQTGTTRAAAKPARSKNTNLTASCSTVCIGTPL
eukprot:1204664-Rhodomonas_salina.1